MPRSVQHYLYPEFFPVRNRDGIRRQLEDLGFSVITAGGEHGLIAEEVREVASPDFDSLIEALERMMKDNGWRYDDWESEIAKSAS